MASFAPPQKRPTAKAPMLAAPTATKRSGTQKGVPRSLGLPGLRITSPGERVEVEADRMAKGALAARAASSPVVAAGGPAPFAAVGAPGDAGAPLGPDMRAFFEPRFGQSLASVRVHTDAAGDAAARSLQARAFAVREHLVFARGAYAPHTETGRWLLAHELAHTVQQRQPGAEPVVARRGADETIAIEVTSTLDEFQPPGSKEIYRVGDAAATRILMDIEQSGPNVVFRVFNFETGTPEEMNPALWSFYVGGQIIGGSRNSGITALGRSLTPAQWRALWPNPLPELLKRFEAGQLALEPQAVLTGFHGLIRTQASRSLDENEKAIDGLLSAKDRVERLQEYATGLREASVVRDTFIRRRDELTHSLAAQHSFTFGPLKTGTGPDVSRQLQIHKERAEVQEALDFWMASFPLLTRLKTEEIAAAPVEAKLREIQANIRATRERLNMGRIDPMGLDTVRARVAGQLGNRATGIVEAEDKARSRRAFAGAAAATAAGIGILFLPGGVFIDAAIGVAIAGDAIANAVEVGRAANTGLHVDDGLVSQAAAQGARFDAVLATVFAMVGAGAAGLRVLRVALVVRGLGRSLPELGLARRTAVARAIAQDRALASTFTSLKPGDAFVAGRVASAVENAGSNVAALRTALKDVAKIAAIPRRVADTPDLYEPLRQITDGSDVAAIARGTGISRAEVEAAKRNLMLEEHILVDNAGLLYRGRFTPFDYLEKAWTRAAHSGGNLTKADRELMTKLIRHEATEGAILSGREAQTLEDLFVLGRLEEKLRKVLRAKGWSQERIAHLLSMEPKPVTPYRYAHLVAIIVHGAGNP